MNRQINILMLGGAKRVSVATKIALMGYRLGISVELFSWELEKAVPIASLAEVIIGCRWNDPQVLEKLHETVVEKKIDMIIPFVDGAIGVAVRYRDRYNDVWVPAGSIESVENMFDKITAARIFEQNSLPIPKTYNVTDYRLPLIAKPRRGSASSGIIVVEDDDRMTHLAPYADDYILQEYIADSDEITVDCYVALSGKPIAIVPRRRIEIVGGEVTRTITVSSPEIVELSATVLKKLDLRGTVTLQFIIDKTDGRIMLMEVNPRLGGGVVCSMHAGANIPEFILTDFDGGELSPCTDWVAGMEIVRYPQEIAFYNGELQG